MSLLEYASKRSRFLPFVKLISFVDQLLEDSEYYVQKGVAWTIREIYNVYPIETLEYLEKNILRIQPEAFLLQLKSSIRLLNPSLMGSGRTTAVAQSVEKGVRKTEPCCEPRYFEQYR